jgi:hypothetical protein
MSIAPLPATLEHLSGRPFAFYPPIRNIPFNEWLYRRATWSECIVANLESGEEFSIPRVFLGEVSVSEEPPADAPAMVVELHPELEFRAGAILPSKRRVIELPVAVVETRSTPRTGHPAPVISIRLERQSEPVAGTWTGKTIAAALVLGVVALTFVVDVARQTLRVSDTGAVSQAWLKLSSSDDYSSVLAKLGPPSRERSVGQEGRAVRVLIYPALRFSVILSGPTRAEQRYMETVDFRGHVLDAESTGILSSR